MDSTPLPDRNDAASQPATQGQRPQPRWLQVRDDTVASDTLLGTDDLLVIEHNGRSYQLRRTRNDKLILTG